MNLSNEWLIFWGLSFWFLLSCELCLAGFSIKIFEIREPRFCIYSDHDIAKHRNRF